MDKKKTVKIVTKLIVVKKQVEVEFYKSLFDTTWMALFIHETFSKTSGCL